MPKGGGNGCYCYAPFGPIGLVQCRTDCEVGHHLRSTLRLGSRWSECIGSASAIQHCWMSIGAFCEARDFAVYLDPRQRVVTKNLAPRFCDARIINDGRHTILGGGLTTISTFSGTVLKRFEITLGGRALSREH